MVLGLGMSGTLRADDPRASFWVVPEGSEAVMNRLLSTLEL